MNTFFKMIISVTTTMFSTLFSHLPCWYCGITVFITKWCNLIHAPCKTCNTLLKSMWLLKCMKNSKDGFCLIAVSTFPVNVECNLPSQKQNCVNSKILFKFLFLRVSFKVDWLFNVDMSCYFISDLPEVPTPNS